MARPNTILGFGVQLEKTETELESILGNADHTAMVLPNRIRELREALGLTQAQIAESAHTTQAQIDRLEKGERRLTLDWMRRLAPALKVRPEDLAREPGERRPALMSIAVRGHVQAGDWREAAEWDRSEWYPVSIAADDRWAGLERFALEVRGNSMDQLYPDHSIIICVRYIELDRGPEAGERVVVLRRNRLGEIEATVKELHVDKDGRLWLWPRSFSPEHQQPLPLPWGAEDWQDHIAEVRAQLPVRAHAGGSDGAEEIVVLAKVVGSYRPE